MLKIKLTILFIFNLFWAVAQNNNIVLQNTLKVAKTDTAKINVLIKLGNYYSESNYDSATIYLKQALNLAQKIKFDIGIATSNVSLGYLDYQQGNYNLALEHYKIAILIRKDLGDQNGLSSCYNNIGLVFESQGNFTKALEQYQNALLIREQLKNKKGIADCLNNIGGIHYTQSNYDKALEYYNKALQINQELNDKSGIFTCINNIGLIFNSKGEHKKAIENFKKAMKICTEINDKIGYTSCLANIGYSNENGGNYEIAIKYYELALQKFDSLGIIQGVIGCQNNIASSYFQLGNYAKTIEFSTKAAEISKKNDSKDDTRIAFKNLYESYQKLNDYRKAFDYYKLYKELNDSIYNNENTKRITQLEMQREFDIKETEQKARLEKQKLITISFIIGFILMLSLAGVVIRSNFQTQKANKLLAKQKNEIENQLFIITKQNSEIQNQLETITHQKSEITDSIHYARKIQNAMLPPQEQISAVLPENFILYKPKDIVSGDFYWFSTIYSGNNLSKIIITAADCTGHGVPGAFMSMLGISLLNEIVNEKQIIEPHEILNHLRINVKQSLRQTGKDNEQQDGMDIALCIIDLDNQKIQYSGANNPLYLIRNGEFIEFKADRMPIGIYPKDNKSFQFKEIDLQSNEMLYIFSDGYVDQVGGAENRKYLSKNFKALLSEICEKPMDIQQQILNDTIENWKGSESQIDDILVIGFKTKINNA